MELKRAAIFVGVIGLIFLGLNRLLWAGLNYTPTDKPITAEHICEVANSDPDDPEDVGRYKHPDACAGKADAMNDRPQQSDSLEYVAGYLEGLSINCFKEYPDGEGEGFSGITPVQRACVLERKAAEDKFRQQNGMEIR